MKRYQIFFYLKTLSFLVAKFSIYLNNVFIMSAQVRCFIHPPLFIIAFPLLALLAIYSLSLVDDSI